MASTAVSRCQCGQRAISHSAPARPSTRIAALPRPSSGPEAAPTLLQRSMTSVATAGAACLLLAGPSFASVPETSQAGSNLGFLSNEEVAERRDALGFMRAFDGKVALKSTKGAPWDVKLDLKSPGTLLLRSPEGQVYYLAFESLTQIDLSDDEVVGVIANSPWEKGSQPVQEMDEEQKLQKLELTREGFYNIISIVDP